MTVIIMWTTVRIVSMSDDKANERWKSCSKFEKKFLFALKLVLAIFTLHNIFKIVNKNDL